MQKPACRFARPWAIWLALCVLLLGVEVSATTYYVSPTGDNGADGLSDSTAWASLRNGDDLGVLVPGDTVFVLPGLYILDKEQRLTTDGISGSPIVYRCADGTAILDDDGRADKVIKLDGKNAVVSGFEIRNTVDHGIQVKADSCVIKNCYIYNIGKRGIDVDAKHCQIRFNVIAACGEDGIYHSNSANSSLIYNNTIYDCNNNGIYLSNGLIQSRVFNNIIVGNAVGINGHAINKCGFNDVWDNISGNYLNGVTDSAGGISVDPNFTDAVAGDFTLTDSSLCIDAGLDLGFRFAGVAPDMGARETSLPSELIVTSPSDTLCADSSYQFDVIGITAVGDTVEVSDITWAHTFGSGAIDASGLYTCDLVGSGQVIASSEACGLKDTSVSLTVVPGVLHSIIVSPESAKVTTDSTLQFHAAGSDVHGNEVTDLGTLDWAVAGGIGTIDTSGLLDPTTAGIGRVRVISNRGPSDNTDTIYVLPGAVVSIDVLPPEQVLGPLESFQFQCVGLDAEGNEAIDLTDSVAWSATGGSITSGGRYTAPLLDADEYVHASYKVLHDSAHVAVSGLLSDIRIVVDGDVSLNDTTFSTDNDTTVLYARAYNALNMPIGYVAVTWEIVGDSIGIVSTDTTTSTVFELTTPGTARIAVVDAQSRRDTTGIITCMAGAPATLDIQPDSLTITTDSTRQFTEAPYDLDGNEAIPQPVISWQVSGGVGGIITLAGLFQPTAPGNGFVIGQAGALVDSTPVTVLPGQLATLEITPDEVTVSADSTLPFLAVGRDAKGLETDAGALTWSVIGAIGEVDSAGVFTPSIAGTGNIVVESDIGGIADTSATITVVPGQLMRLEIMPAVASVSVGDTVIFTATGYDANDNVTSAGNLYWREIGRVGSVNDSGRFVATAPGKGRVSAASDLGSLVDSTDIISVEELLVSSIPLGSQVARAGAIDAPLLAFSVLNYYLDPKDITSITVENASNGLGGPGVVVANASSAKLYLDVDKDSLISAADSLLDEATFHNPQTTFEISSLTIDPDSAVQCLVAVDIDDSPCDGDTLDAYLNTATGLEVADGSIPLGPDSLNSLGYVLLDGMVSSQISMQSSEVEEVGPGGLTYHLITLDLPRNGYAQDTLEGLSVVNVGTATAADIDRLSLYRDDGNGVWGGIADEQLAGHLVFTGSRWSISGLTSVLDDSSNRYFVTVTVADFPANGATIRLRLPVNGVEVRSLNDGPLDAAITAGQTVTISTSESVAIRAIDVAASTLVPGTQTAPIFGVELQNSFASGVSIDSLALTMDLTSSDGANLNTLLTQVDSVFVYLDRDGDVETISTTDSLLASSAVTQQRVMLDMGGTDISGAGGMIRLAVSVTLNIEKARNGNRVGVTIAAASDLFLTGGEDVTGDYPIANETQSIVDAFPVASVEVVSLPALTLYGGQRDRVVNQFTLPGDGYAPALLQRMVLVNEGSLDERIAISSVALLGESGVPDQISDDQVVGEFTPVGNEWVLDNVVAMIGSAGRMFSVVVDVESRQFEGGTLDLTVPAGGIRYSSGTQGPDDGALANGEAHLVFPSDRITAISVPGNTGVLYPGSSGNLMLTFGLYNGYVSQSQILEAVEFSNISLSAVSLDYADQELGQISLYYDQNNNRVFDNDPLVAAGSFSGQRLFMSGIDVTLASEELSFFFVTASIPISVTDADSLAIAIEQPSDLIFAQSDDITINGDMPLTNGGFRAIDGSVSEQYSVFELPPTTLRPGDTSVPLFSFVPATNGALSDTLESLTIANRATATNADLDSLTLWLDLNGDEVWQPTDSVLATFAYAGAVWVVSGLSLGLQGDPPTLFVTGDVTASATPGAVFQPSIPVNGCQYASGNDGPVDRSLDSENTFTVSSSGLRLLNQPLAATYSVGQTITIDVTATNLLAVPLSDVSGEIVGIDAPSLVRLDSAVTGPVALNPGESTNFVYHYTALDSGQVSWYVRAVAPSQPDSSATVHTRVVSLQQAIAEVEVELINSVPTSVARGQRNVFPLSVRCIHPAMAASFASLRLDSLTIKVMDQSGQAQPASDVFERLSLFSGFTSLAVMDNVSSSEYVNLVFSGPVVIDPGQQFLLSLLVDIDAAAAADGFSLAIESAAHIQLSDKNTLEPVPMAPSVVFPLSTEYCRIDDPSQQVAVSYVPLLGSFVNRGQEIADLVKVYLRHPGSAGSSQIQFTALSISMTDDTGLAVNAGTMLSRIEVTRGPSILGQVSGSQLDAVAPLVQFNAPITLSAGEIDSILVRCGIQQDPLLDSFGAVITDSTDFVVRDLTSGSVVAATTDTTVLATGSVFPIATGLTTILNAAMPLDLCISSTLPEAVVGGRDSLSLLALEWISPSDSTYSGTDLLRVEAGIEDSLGIALDPTALFDRIGIRVNGGSIAYQPFIDVVNLAVSFDLASQGVTVDPGDTVITELVADIEADNPFSHFKLTIPSDSRVHMRDATDSLRSVSVGPSASCGFSIPYASAVTRIYLPAGQPRLNPEAQAVRITHPGEAAVTALLASLNYQSATPQGDVNLESVSLCLHSRGVPGVISIGADQVISGCRLYIDDHLVSSAADLTSDTLRFIPASPFALSNGTSTTMRVEVDIADDAPIANYFLTLDDSTSVAMTDRNLASPVFPSLGSASFPIQGAELAVSSASLESSFSNFPNPFLPGRGDSTVISYVLAEDAQVDIELFSLTGELVAVVAADAFRSEGANQSDVWYGDNQDGRVVMPGTYFCRITARYASGREESFRRKIAVIR